MENLNIGFMQYMAFWANAANQCRETVKRPASPSGVYASPAKRQKQEVKRRVLKPLKVKESKESCIERRLLMQGVPILQKSEVNLTRKKLGEGSYGSCYKSVDPRTKEVVVIKKFSGGSSAWESLVDEAITLSKLQVEGVQRLVGVCLKPRLLVTGFAGVTVREYINNGASLADVVSVCLQVSRTLQRINQHGYAHNDIKRENVCISTNGGVPVATIIDVGVTRPVGTIGTFDDDSGTDRFPHIAPELLLNTFPCGEASDVFGLAYLIQTAGLTKTQSQCPSMASLLTWVREARCAEPSGRPSLAPLIEVLEQLHMEAAF